MAGNAGKDNELHRLRVALIRREFMLAAGHNIAVQNRMRNCDSHWDQRRQSRNGPFCHGEELWMALNRNTLVTDCYGRGNCGAITHKGIKDYAYSRGESKTALIFVA